MIWHSLRHVKSRHNSSGCETVMLFDPRPQEPFFDLRVCRTPIQNVKMFWTQPLGTSRCAHRIWPCSGPRTSVSGLHITNVLKSTLGAEARILMLFDQNCTHLLKTCAQICYLWAKSRGSDNPPHPKMAIDTFVPLRAPLQIKIMVSFLTTIHFHEFDVQWIWYQVIKS